MINNCDTELCREGNCLGCKDGKPNPNDPRCAPYCYPVVHKKETVDNAFFAMMAFFLFLLFLLFLMAYLFLRKKM